MQQTTDKILGLAERTQPSASEIYTPTSIPTGDAMPTYTQTPTSAESISFDSAEKARQERRMDVAMRNLLKSTSEECRLLFKLFQNKYEDQIFHRITSLMIWVGTEEHMKDCPLTVDDYDRRIKEEQGELKAMDDRLPVDKYFRLGADDTAKCGHLLIIKQRVWDEAKQIYATVLLSGIQWLMRQREELVAVADSGKGTQKEETTTEAVAQAETTFNEALKKLCIDCLKLNGKGQNTQIGEKQWNKTRIMVCLMHVLADRGTLPTSDEKSYAQLIAPFIGKNPDNVRKNINKCQLTIKPYGRNLKELNEDYIKNHPSDDERAMSAREFKEQWSGMFELIDAFISSQEELAPLRVKAQS